MTNDWNFCFKVGLSADSLHITQTILVLYTYTERGDIFDHHIWPAAEKIILVNPSKHLTPLHKQEFITDNL